MDKSDITLIIPTYNMSKHLSALFDSLISSGLETFVEEIIIVNDGSTDDTMKVAEEIAQRNKEHIKIIDLKENKGRFLARYYGAKEAKTNRILFLDSRNELSPEFVKSLSVSGNKYSNIIGNVDIDINRNVFCLYWDRTHKFIFKKHYAAAQDVIVLSPDNYDDYLKGTTVFLCRRALFIDSCEKFLSSPLLNDDTYLMKEMVKHEPLVIHPNVRINWIPRENYWDFNKRLFERGPSFVEYHVFEHRGAFFWSVIGGLLLLFSLIVLSFIKINLAIYSFLFLIGLIFFSTAFFAKSIKEFFLMAPLHFGTIIFFGTGILYGLVVNMKKILWNKFFQSTTC